MATNVIGSITDLDGYGKLGDADKTLINELIAKENAARSKPLPREPDTNKIKPLQTKPKLRKDNLASSHLPAIQVMFTNADQLTSSKMSELLKLVKQKKPLVITVCEVKPKNAKERVLKDYEIPGYSLHPVNLELEDTGRGIAVYTHSSLDNSIIQIQPDISFDEACLLEIRLRGGDLLLFGCIYRSPTPTCSSEKNNENLNQLLQYISKKNYTHKCFVGDFNFKDINWLSSVCQVACFFLFLTFFSVFSVFSGFFYHQLCINCTTLDILI